MNYLLKNNQTKTLRQKMFRGIGIFIFFLLLRLIFADAFSSLAYTAAKPVWNFRDVLSGSHASIQSYTETKESLIARIQAKDSQIYDLQLKNMELSATAEALSKQAGVEAVQSEKNRLVAKVLSKPPYSPFDAFILDSGTDGGIKLGSNVYVGSNTLIGKITKVESAYSEATLFSSGSSAFDTRVLRTGETVSIHGNGGGNFVATLPKDFDAVAGDILVDGSLSQHVVAEIYSIDDSSQGSFKKIYARLPINVFQTEWVGIEK